MVAFFQASLFACKRSAVVGSCSCCSSSLVLALMCLGAWSMLGLVENDDIKAIASLSDVVDDDNNMDVEWDYVDCD